jgi:rhamnosyltransferase
MATKASSSLLDADPQRRSNAAVSGAGVAAIVVTFRPDIARLADALASVVEQVERVIVVDNGEGVTLPGRLADDPRIDTTALGENRGIAAAQNVGIEAALAGGAQFVLLLDQDSVPAPDMVRWLLDARDQAAADPRPLAAVGAASYGPHGIDGFVRVAFGRFARVNPAAVDGPVDCDQLIASGCLVSAQAWKRIGPMDESLFIDKVDTDWCLRARHLGYRLIGAPAARLEHRLGNRRLRVWVGRWREMPIHDPVRYYYMLRNSALLWRRPHSTWPWIAADLHYCLRLLAVVLIAGSAGSAARRTAIAGIRDGWLGVAGRWPHHPT